MSDESKAFFVGWFVGVAGTIIGANIGELIL